jgi:serine/threonine protein kinase
MAFLDKLKKKLPFLDNGHHGGHSGGGSSSGGFLSPFSLSSSSHKFSKKKYPHLIVDKDPAHVWEIVNEIGDGAFGKVYKARNRETGVLAAAKIVEKCSEDEIDDYIVEIDILNECKHKNIVHLFEAYYHDSKLWVRKMKMQF